jgi:hypothetical protein
MGRMVECGACENRFRLSQEFVVPTREKSYPGDLKRPGLRGAARVPLGEAGPVAFQSIQYESSATAADVIPLSPQRKVSIMVGVGIIVLGILIFVVGSEPEAMLQDIDQVKRFVIGVFVSVAGGGLIIWGTRQRKGGWLSALGAGVLVLVLAGSMPIRYTLEPDIVNAPVKPLPIDGGRSRVESKAKRPTAEEMETLIGYNPVKKAWINHTIADRDGRERVAALWIPGMEERFKFQIQKYLQRILETSERPSYLGRRGGGLFVVGGIDVDLEQVVQVVSNFGTVDDIYPEIGLITMSIDGDRFLGVSRELMDKLTDRNNQAFYVRNLQELNHIDIDRVKEAAQRLASVEPKRFWKEIAIRLTGLLAEESGTDYKGVFVEALAVWSEPGDGADLVVAQTVTVLMGEGGDIPRSMIDFLVERESATAGPLVEALWSNDPQAWESTMVDLGSESEEAAAQKLNSPERGLQFSAVNILKRVGTSASIPALRAQKAQVEDEEVLLKLEGAILSIEARG